jgi:hypothetical protein
MITHLSRDPRDLTRDLHFAYLCLHAHAQTLGLSIFLTRTASTKELQKALYMQGREKLDAVNFARKSVDLPAITAEQNNKIVTQTLKSLHIKQKTDSKETNGRARAFDICIMYNGKAIWDVKADVNEDHIPDYTQLASFGESLGLKAGAFFPTLRDFVHYEHPTGIIPSLRLIK